MEENEQNGLIPGPELDKQIVEEGENTTPVELNSSPKPVEDTPVSDTPETPEPEHVEKIVDDTGTTAFTPEQQKYINDLVGKTRMETRERTMRYVYERYGANDENDLDNLVGNAQKYDSLKDEYDTMKKDSEDRESRLNDLSEQIALLQSGINESNYDDIKFLLRGKGMPVTAENIQLELDSHPYWKKTEKLLEGKVEPISRLQKPVAFGNETVPSQEESEKSRAMRLFGLK